MCVRMYTDIHKITCLGYVYVLSNDNFNQSAIR